MEDKLEIIMDTREKHDFFLFESYPDVEVTRKKLKTGDYTVKGFENKITVDRKANTKEWYMNIGQQRKRFANELDRMRSFDEAYFICAFPFSYFSIFPEKSSIPEVQLKNLKITPSYLRLRVYQIQEQYPTINFIFCDNKDIAEQKTYEVLRAYYDKNKSR